MDCAFEFIGVDEGLMGELIRLEAAPDWLDIVEFRGIRGQPLDGEPVGASGRIFRQRMRRTLRRHQNRLAVAQFPAAFASLGPDEKRVDIHFTLGDARHASILDSYPSDD